MIYPIPIFSLIIFKTLFLLQAFARAVPSVWDACLTTVPLLPSANSCLFIARGPAPILLCFLKPLPLHLHPNSSSLPDLRAFLAFLLQHFFSVAWEQKLCSHLVGRGLWSQAALVRNLTPSFPVTSCVPLCLSKLWFSYL